MASTIREISRQDSVSIAELYQQVRARTMQIVAPLEIEDYVIQTAEFMSPPRWHIGHTSWFFETVLQAHKPGYRVYSEDFLFYFNSYYEGFGERIERPKRGTKSRPTVRETVAYRNHIDEQVLALLQAPESLSDTLLSLVRLGLEHEMQHQELLVYDIKHLLSDQFDVPMKPLPQPSTKVEGMAEIEGGLFTIGYNHAGASRSYDFAFDNEKPAHQVYLHDYALDKALVSNGDFLEFINDSGYQNFRWWFSEGWTTVNQEQWRAPLYWELHDGEWMIRDFAASRHVEEKRASFSRQLFRSLSVCEVGWQETSDRSGMGEGCVL